MIVLDSNVKSLVKLKLKESVKRMKSFDITDAVFLATAFVLDASLWSDDKDFEKQNIVKVNKTIDMIRLLEK